MHHHKTVLSQFTTSGHIFRLALPVIVGQISKTFVQVVDSIFIGRLGTLQLGAVALVTTLAWAILTIADGFSVGLTASIARMTGAKMPGEAGLFFRTGISTMGILGILIAPVAILLTGSLFSAINMPTDLYGYGSDYMTHYLLFLPSVFLFSALEASFRGSGDTRTPMLVGLLLNVVNILLDWIMIYGKFGFPALGVRGAALATGISFTTGSILLYALSRRRPWGMRIRGPAPGRGSSLSLLPPVFSLSHLGRIVKISLPASGEQLTMSISQLILMAIAVNPLGSAHVASFHIVMRLASLSFMPGFGFAIAAATLSGQNLGSGRPERAGRLVWHSVFYCALVMAVISVCYFAFPRALVGLFSPDHALQVLSRLPMRVYALFALFLAPTMVLGGGLRGAGDTKFPMIYMMLSRFLVRLPLGWLLSIRMGLGLAGVWVAMCSDFFIRAVLLAIHTLRGRWKTKII
ncbi:MAG: MATE family efflux transporter [Spirochaetales bacterium]|nr:MAG: MATE family efflux transporter [Spirochaetales bacterium]